MGNVLPAVYIAIGQFTAVGIDIPPIIFRVVDFIQHVILQRVAEIDDAEGKASTFLASVIDRFYHQSMDTLPYC